MTNLLTIFNVSVWVATTGAGGLDLYHYVYYASQDQRQVLPLAPCRGANTEAAQCVESAACCNKVV